VLRQVVVLRVNLRENEVDVRSHEVRVDFHCNVQIIPVLKDKHVVKQDLELSIFFGMWQHTCLEELLFIR